MASSSSPRKKPAATTGPRQSAPRNLPFPSPCPYQATSASPADGGGDVFRPPPPTPAFELFEAVPAGSGGSTKKLYYDEVLDFASPPYQATSPAAADGGDVFPPPPPETPYYLYDGVPAGSGGRTEEFYYDEVLLSPRSPSSFPFADAAASASPTATSAESKNATAALSSAANSGWYYFSVAKGGGLPGAGGETWSSAASVDGKGAFIHATEAAASSPGPSGSTAPHSAANSTWAPFFSLAKGGDGKGVPGGERGSSPASVDGKAIARAGFILAPEAAASRPGPSGSTARSGWALSSQAEAGQPSSSTSPRSASSSAYVPHDGIALCTCKCNQCKKAELNSLSSAEEEESLRGLIAAEADPSSVGKLRHVGSNYWDHFPVSEDLNPAGFYSRHPLWEGFALPAKLEGKMGFQCVFCDKKFVGSADKGVNHMLRNKGCLISDVHRQILFDKVDAYRKRKQDLLKRKRGRQI